MRNAHGLENEAQHNAISRQPGAVAPPAPSLGEVHRTVPVVQRHWWQRLFAFAGPAYMVSVGYMDPGNWATDLEGGARFGYRLIWVLLASNMAAVLLQTLSARLGLVTGRDLAQACRDGYPTPVRWALYVLCEIAIAACDLAELLGTAIGLNLLFNIPLLWAVVITGFDVFVLLALQGYGIRKMEAFIVALISTIGLCFIVEIFLSKPSWSGVASGFVPHYLTGDSLYIAIGIIGATVMPHNLYLHSSLVQSRNVGRKRKSIAQACKYNLIDSAIALNAAFFVNAAILILAAATFFKRGVVVTEIQQAHSLLDSLLGSKVAPVAFAVALICAGQSSTLTGTLAGQITMEGFLHFKMRPWLRRMITRGLAIVPAMIAIWIMGDQGSYRLLILSQVILSLQLPFAIVPLVKFTSSRTKMGPFVNRWWVKTIAWIVTAVIVALNAQLVIEEIRGWHEAAGAYGWLVLATAVPSAGGLGLLLVWMTFRRLDKPIEPISVSVEEVLNAAAAKRTSFRRIGVALEVRDTDSQMLSKAVPLAEAHGAEIILMHVVEGVGGQWYGQQTGDLESRGDEAYLDALAESLRTRLTGSTVPAVHVAVGYGGVVAELVRLAKANELDLLVLGGHGHRRLADVFAGETIPGVRHGLSIPILAVREED